MHPPWAPLPHHGAPLGPTPFPHHSPILIHDGTTAPVPSPPCCSSRGAPRPPPAPAPAAGPWWGQGPAAPGPLAWPQGPAAPSRATGVKVAPHTSGTHRPLGPSAVPQPRHRPCSWPRAPGSPFLWPHGPRTVWGLGGHPHVAPLPGAGSCPQGTTCARPPLSVAGCPRAQTATPVSPRVAPCPHPPPVQVPEHGGSRSGAQSFIWGLSWPPVWSRSRRAAR